jgi:hypothetical protein
VKRLLVAGVLLAPAACTRADEARPAARAALRKAVESPPSRLEKLIVDLETCPLEGYQITSTCPAMVALAAELSGRKPELSIPLGSRLLAHRAPAVRVQTAAMLGASGANAIVDAARGERDARVLEAMIKTLAPGAAQSPRVAAFLLEATQHLVPGVRAQSLAALALPANRSIPGAAARVLAMAERDPDPALRREACAAGGKLGDASFVPFYERITENPTDAALHAACMEGIVAMFHNAPAFDTANEAAYRLFLRRISAQPRSEYDPPWQVMSTFCYDSREADLERLAAWRKNATWFDASEVKAALSSVIADRSTSWKARAAAIESMVGLGATPDELKALAAGYASGSDPGDARVLATLDRATAF